MNRNRQVTALFLLVLLVSIGVVAGVQASPAAQTGDPTPTPSAPPFEVEITPESTDEVVEIFIEPVIADGVQPPYEIDLPDDWDSAYFTLLVQEFEGVGSYPLAVYRGPVPDYDRETETVTGEDTTGIIIVFWGFSSPTRADPITGAALAEPDIWVEGLRLWRSFVVEAECTVGTDLRRDFVVGDRDAVGTFVSAVDCPDGLPDVSGWFAGLQVEGLPFIFYAYTSPEAILGPARVLMRDTLNSVQFRVIEFLTATPPPPPTRTPAVTATPEP